MLHFLGLSYQYFIKIFMLLCIILHFFDFDMINITSIKSYSKISVWTLFHIFYNKKSPFLTQNLINLITIILIFDNFHYIRFQLF